MEEETEVRFELRSVIEHLIHTIEIVIPERTVKVRKKRRCFRPFA